MVRATIIVSAIFALATYVSAAPQPGLLGINAKHHIGTQNINLQGALQKAVNLQGLHVHDIGQGFGLLGIGKYSRRDESSANVVRISRKAGAAKPANEKKAEPVA